MKKLTDLAKSHDVDARYLAKLARDGKIKGKKQLDEYELSGNTTHRWTWYLDVRSFKKWFKNFRPEKTWSSAELEQLGTTNLKALSDALGRSKNSIKIKQHRLREKFKK